MKNALYSSVIVSSLAVMSSIGTTTSAGEQNEFKTNQGTHALKTQPVFPLAQKTTQKVEGKVRFYNIVDTEFANNHLVDPDLTEKKWMVSHYDRMQVYAPWFNDFRVWYPTGLEHIDHTEWYPNGLEYKDFYAIYDCAQESVQNSCEGLNEEHHAMYDRAMQAEADPDLPDWILKDSQGNPLYTPFGCHDGTCPQFAADLSNPAFRDFWIEQMSTVLEAGNYRGLFIDDVNLDLNRAVSDGNKCTIASNACNWTVEIDEVDWAGFVADFTEEIRSAFPDKEIVHNSVWFHANPGDPFLERQVVAADYINLERGINDPGMQAGWEPFGVAKFLYFNDYLRELGRNMIHFIHINSLANNEEFSQDNPIFTQAILPPIKQIEYGLAGWLLVSDGQDLFGADQFNTPDDWWHGFDTDLGPAQGARYLDADGLIRRDFKYGIVLLNGPGTWPVTVTLPETFYTLAGDRVDEIVLGPRVAKILLRNSPAIDSFVTP